MTLVLLESHEIPIHDTRAFSECAYACVCACVGVKPAVKQEHFCTDQS
jgi:hypothetical protein